MTDLTELLADLARPAPATVAPAVLVETGVADVFATFDGPSGSLTVAANPRGVSAVAPTTHEFAAEFADRFQRPAYPTDRLPGRLHGRVERALDSGRIGTLPIDLRTQTDFQRAVLSAVASIPPGEVRPYGWVARQVGKPRAVRAVGSAVGQNPIPVLVPCHRVVRSDGHVGAYRFGPTMKHQLLQAEGVDWAVLDEHADRRQSLLGSATTHIVCFPTCSHARRISERHQRWFANPHQASEAGFRPCRRCEPFDQ